MDFSEHTPIYQQVSDHIKTLILDDDVVELEALPSVRMLSTEFQINPITVSKALQGLVTESIIEKRRGLGMFVVKGAKAKLLQEERQHFFDKDWPHLLEKLNRLHISRDELSW